MSVLKVTKEISKLLNQETEETSNPGEIFLITDSKGKHLKTVVPGRLRAYLNIIYKSGATIDSDVLRIAHNKIRRANRPTVLLWFGTCELTIKKGKYTELNTCPYQHIEALLTRYRETKQNIININSRAQIYFIECPYFSIYRWNKFHGKTYTETTEAEEKQQDTILKDLVDYYNQQLPLINCERTIKIPTISQDQIISSKKRRLKKTKNKVNYNLLHIDGVHPKKPIARLWVHRFVKLGRDIRNSR